MSINKLLPEVWMISMSDCEVSQHYKSICQPSWEQQGFKVNHFEAITPSSPEFNSGRLKFSEKKGRTSYRGPVEFSDTEKAVWYSHFLLWEKLSKLRKSSIVIEHDVKLMKLIEPEMFENPTLAYTCLCEFDYKVDGKMVSQPSATGAYYMRRNFAEHSVQKVLHVNATQNIYMNIDCAVDLIVDDARILHPEYNYRIKADSTIAKQIVDEEIGTTIEHLLNKSV
jgi:hypothetical protein